MDYQSIFGLRFQSNAALQPSAEDMRSFLARHKDGAAGAHRDDLLVYQEYVARVRDFERGHGPAASDMQGKIVLNALSHSQFFKHTLQTAVEQFKYHRSKLLAVDLKKPIAFIRSAEEEISRLNPKKKEDQGKIARLQQMVDLRAKDVARMTKSRQELVEELLNIALYVKDNLIAITSLCETSITALVGLHIEGAKTNQLIEDIKNHFKEQVRDQLRLGPVTKEYVETLKQNVAQLSKQLSHHVLEDIYGATKVYEEIHDHTKLYAGRFAQSIDSIKGLDADDADAIWATFGAIEDDLVRLISSLRLDTAPGKAMPAESEFDKIIFEKRAELLSHLFTLLKKGATSRPSMLELFE